MWQSWIFDGEHAWLDPSPYRRAICRLATIIGDILTGQRRLRSWALEPIFRSKLGFAFYVILRNLILYQSHRRGTYYLMNHNYHDLNPPDPRRFGDWVERAQWI